VKFLHTSDWHVGKRIRGHSRADEHRAVFAEMTELAAAEQVDLVLVAGDLFETAAPTAESELIVNQALLGFAEIAPVMVIAGNHDNPRRLAAVEPLLKLGRITMVAEPRSPDDGGVATITADDGTPVHVALLPFVSQRSIIRAGDLMSGAGFENAQTYGERMQRVIEALCSRFEPDHVNILMAHAFVHGGSSGGGERPAHLVDEYALATPDFPPSASYVALGHLHRAQQMLGATAIHYCGSPLQLDFGEQDQAKQVNLVSAEPGLPAKVTGVALNGGKRLRTLTGTVAELGAIAADDDLGDDWIRVRVTEPGRAGLAEEVRELLGPGVVDVRVERQEAATAKTSREGRTPQQLFGDYLKEMGVADARLQTRFAELLDESGSEGGTEAGSDTVEAGSDTVEVSS
jgi:exonuclease SbcD